MLSSSAIAFRCSILIILFRCFDPILSSPDRPKDLARMTSCPDAAIKKSSPGQTGSPVKSGNKSSPGYAAGDRQRKKLRPRTCNQLSPADEVASPRSEVKQAKEVNFQPLLQRGIGI